MAKVQVETRDDSDFVTLIFGAASAHNDLPTWMRFSEGCLDEAQLLYGGKWDDEDSSVITVIGPTSRAMSTLHGAVGAGKSEPNKHKAQVALMSECLFSIPEKMVLRRPFKFNGKVVLDKGDPFVPPMDLEIPTELKDKRKAIVEEYILGVLPSRLWAMVLTAGTIMGTPDIEQFLRRRIAEAAAAFEAAEEAKLAGEEPPEEPEDDSPNSPEDSPGSSGET